MDAHGELGETQRLARIGSWHWNFESGEDIVSKGLRRIFGREDIPPFDEQSGTLYSPETWEVLNTATLLARTTGVGYDLDLPALRGDGSPLWIHTRGEAIRNEAGDITGLRGVVQDISERRHLEQSARFNADLLNTVGQAVIATDPQGNVTYMNRAAETLYGWSAAESLGRDIKDITVPQPSRTQAESIMAELLAGRPWAGEFLVQHRNGTTFPAEVHNTPLLNSTDNLIGVIGISTDISERKRAETALELARGKLNAAFDTSAVGFIVSDSTGCEISMNATAQRLLGDPPPGDPGVSREDGIAEWELSRADGTVIPYEEWPSVRAIHGDFARDLELHCHNRRTGKRGICNFTISPVRNSDGQVMHIVQTLVDVTETRRLDRALHLNNIELEKARAGAEKANLAKSEFLSSMSHELRSPLHTILGFAQLMDGDDPPPTLAQAASVEQILKAGWYLLELITEILDLAQVESGKLAISREPTSLTEVLRECRAMILPQRRKRGIQVTFPETGNPYFVDADRTRLKQILINLISNAIKYNREDGSVVVECTAVGGDILPGRVRVTIRDTGAGLSPEMLLQLFQPFNRLGREFTEMEGTGIGLVMSKRLVELMGGVIGVESTVGTGSIFWFELNSSLAPLAVLESGDYLAPTQAHPDPAAPIVTVLCVEDNLPNRELIEKIIRSRRPNIRLVCAGTAREGIQIARTQQPDMILMDINLPGMNGIEALQVLRKDPITNHIPVVALSANAMPADVKKGLDAGFFRYLTKPIKIPALIDTIDQAIEYGLVFTE